MAFDSPIDDAARTVHFWETGLIGLELDTTHTNSMTIRRSKYHGCLGLQAKVRRQYMNGLEFLLPDD